MEKEFTKIVNAKCMCGKAIQVLCNESAKIVGVRCTRCFHAWLNKNLKAERRQNGKCN